MSCLSVNCLSVGGRVTVSQEQNLAKVRSPANQIKLDASPANQIKLDG